MPEFEEDALALRIYVGEADRVEGEPVYKRIVKELRERGIWGATVLRGTYGFGKKSVLHAAFPLRLSSDLPVVVEAVDSATKIRDVIPTITPLVKDGLVTTHPVTVVTYVSGGGAPGAGEEREREA